MTTCEKQVVLLHAVSTVLAKDISAVFGVCVLSDVEVAAYDSLVLSMT